MRRRRILMLEERHADEADRAGRRVRSAPAARLQLRPEAETVRQLQSTAGNRAVSDALHLQRDRKPPKPAGENAPKPGPAKGPHQRLFIVRDKTLGLGGGTLVTDLAHLKRAMMALKSEDEWTLVLSVHGSEDRLGAQAPPNWQKDAVFYEAKDIDNLFDGDKDYVKWRDKFGPIHLSLVSCQVSVSFEGTLINNLTRPGSKGSRDPKRGLGEGCKPIASVVTLNDAPRSRTAVAKLPAGKQQSVKEQLSELNAEWGYYGVPPVPEDQLIDYYYGEDPKPGWVTVEVFVGKGHDVAALTSTGIPYWNRTIGPKSAQFRTLCTQGVGGLKRTRQPTAPTPSDE